MAGIKETQEVIDAVFSYSEEAFKLAADGIGVADGVQLAMNPTLLSKAKLAAEGASALPEEAKDIDVLEAEILMAQFVDGIGRNMLAAGIKSDNKIFKVLKSIPRVAKLAKHNIAEGKAIYAEFGE